MTEPQLNLLGDDAQPVDDHLGPAQRAVIRVLRRAGSMTVDEAGAIVHAGRSKHTVDELCAWCGHDGAEVVAALIRRNLAEPTTGGMRLSKPSAGQEAAPGLPARYLSEFGY